MDNTPNGAGTKEWLEVTQALNISTVVPSMYTSNIVLADDPNTFAKEEDRTVSSENDQVVDPSNKLAT